jgi:hypothetical protein
MFPGGIFLCVRSEPDRNSACCSGDIRGNAVVNDRRVIVEPRTRKVIRG